MNKKEKLKSIKLALLISVTYEAEISSDIDTLAGSILDDLYNRKAMQKSTFLFGLERDFYEQITTDKMIIVKLCIDTISEVEFAKKIFEQLKRLLENENIYHKKNIDLHNKIETLIRIKWQTEKYRY